jgi:penicillin amidase
LVLCALPPALAQTAPPATTLRLPGLTHPVTVLRDTWGIPHIYAETQDDLFFAQGFVAAQDRLFQMELWRRTGEGRLAEIVGKSAVERDRFARLVRYRGDLKTEYESYAPDAQAIVEAFVRGVNAYIETVKNDLPLEFRLAGFAPEPWTPEVCLTRLAGWGMTGNASLEVLRAKLAREIGADLVDELVATDPPRKIEIPAGLDLAGIDEGVLGGALAAGAPVTFEPQQGSNNWVIDGSLSATGKPLLANDPHRSIQLPSLRWMVHLVGPGWNVIGAGEPALPGVAAGHNDRIGFGFTIVGIDQQDLYVEATNPANPNEVRWNGRWVPMRIEHERIAVKGGAPVEVDLKFTAHGPVLHEDPVRHRAYALRWVGSEPGTAGYLAGLSLDRARSWPEFLRATERWKVPAENILYADVDGNIGWQVTGLTPVRPNGKDAGKNGWAGLLPVPGDGRFEWQGFLPPAELPRSFNPATHSIATANHNILPPGYSHELGYEWAPPFRFQRIGEMLGSLRTADHKLTVEDFERMQLDTVSIPARRLVRLLAAAQGASPEIRQWVERLAGWDGSLGRDSSPAALYEFWLRKLPAAIFKPKLPEAAWKLAAGFIGPEKVLDVLETASPRWFGPGEVGKTARDAALLTALDAAVAEARKELGPDPATWRWGSLHKTPFHHPLAIDAERKAQLDLPSPERGGDGDTVMAASGRGWGASHGASFREILDPGDWDRSVAINVPGQSGRPGSPHYGDLLPLWADGRYIPFLFSREAVEKAATERLTLEPPTSPQLPLAPAPPDIPGATVMDFIEFGAVPVFRPAGEPSQVVILLSGSQGVGAQEAEVGNALAGSGALVLAVDVPRYVETVAKSKAECLYPGAELRELSQSAQARNNLTSYHTPILVGVGTGGGFAFVSLAQAPSGNFAGAISLGFCPLVVTEKELCHSNGIRWDRQWTGPGVRLLPDRRLDAPWIVFDTPTPPAGCPPIAKPPNSPDSVPDIVPAMPTASRVRLPAGLSPEAAASAWKSALPAAFAKVIAEHKKSEEARKARLGDLADLPLIEVPAEAPPVDALAVDVTGSGGYEGFDIEIGQALAAQGVPVVALSSLDYFWINRDPDGAARDLARVLDHYLAAWHKSKAVLFGYSQGADILPFMVNRLPAPLRAKVAAVGLIGPDDTAELDNGLSDYTAAGRTAPPKLPVAPEIARAQTDNKLVCIYGKTERGALCPKLDPQLGVDLFTVPTGHAFQGHAPQMIARVLTAAGLTVRPVAPAPPEDGKPAAPPTPPAAATTARYPRSSPE